jgi:DNA-binding IclR family transcriptional regulator
MARKHPFTDQVSLMGKEADVYEAIATLEYLGRPVRIADIVSATGLDEAVVCRALRAMTERGVLVEHEEDGQYVYEPAYRGWSTAPEQSAGPRR